MGGQKRELRAGEIYAMSRNTGHKFVPSAAAAIAAAASGGRMRRENGERAEVEADVVCCVISMSFCEEPAVTLRNVKSA